MSLYDNLKQQITEYRRELEEIDKERRDDMIGIATFVDLNGFIYSQSDKRWVRYNGKEFKYLSNEDLIDLYFEYKKEKTLFIK